MAQSDGTPGEPNGPAICLRTTARTSTAIPTGTIGQRLAGRAVRGAGAITDSRHSGTVSSTVRVYRASWNAMKPRIQCVAMNSGFQCVREASRSV